MIGIPETYSNKNPCGTALTLVPFGLKSESILWHFKFPKRNKMNSGAPNTKWIIDFGGVYKEFERIMEDMMIENNQ